MHVRHLPIATPCHEDWNAMEPAERGRFCRSCAQRVYDLSDMTEQAARSLLTSAGSDSICVRYRHDASGRIRFRAEAFGRTAVLALSMAACTPHEHPAPRLGAVVVVKPAPEPEPELVGQVAYEEPEPEKQVVPVPNPGKVMGRYRPNAPTLPDPIPEPRPLMGKPMPFVEHPVVPPEDATGQSDPDTR